MLLQQRAQLSRLVDEQREDGNLPSFKMSGQLETVSKQRLHHQTHLILGGLACGLGINIETILHRPRRQLRQ